MINIHLEDLPIQKLNIEIIDILGKVIYKDVLNVSSTKEVFTYDVSDLLPGNYYVKVSTG